MKQDAELALVSELESLNIDELDVEELEQRLELSAADCDCWGNGCSSYCNPPPKDT